MKEGSLIPADATSGFLTVRTKPKSRECAKLQSYPGTGWSEPLGLEGQGLGEGALRFTDAVSHSTTGPIRKPNSWTEGLATHRQWLDRLSLEQGRCWTCPPQMLRLLGFTRPLRKALCSQNRGGVHSFRAFLPTHISPQLAGCVPGAPSALLHYCAVQTRRPPRLLNEQA